MEFFKPFKPLSVGFYHVNPHFPSNVINECNKIFFPFPQTCSSWATIIEDFVACFFVPLYSFAAYCLPSMHALLANVEVGWEILLIFMPSPCLECKNASHIQMSKSAVPKLLRIVYYMWTHDVGHTCTAYLHESRHSHLPQCIRLTPLTKTCLSRANWFATWTREAHSSHFSYCFNSNNNGSHSDGFSHAIIIYVHIAWRNYLLGVWCNLVQSHVLCGSRIYDAFANALWMCSMLQPCDLYLWQSFSLCSLHCSKM